MLWVTSDRPYKMLGFEPGFPCTMQTSYSIFCHFGFNNLNWSSWFTIILITVCFMKITSFLIHCIYHWWNYYPSSSNSHYQIVPLCVPNFCYWNLILVLNIYRKYVIIYFFNNKDTKGQRKLSALYRDTWLDWRNSTESKAIF